MAVALRGRFIHGTVTPGILELISDGCTCVLNGDALVPGHAFTLHHGDRLFIGTERLLLVSLWRPDHDGSHDHAAAANAAKGFGSYAIAPPQSPSKPPDTSGGARFSSRGGELDAARGERATRRDWLTLPRASQIAPSRADSEDHSRRASWIAYLGAEAL